MSDAISKDEETAISVSFRIDGLPPSPNETKGLHWTKLEKIKKEWMGYVGTAAMVAKSENHLRGLYDFADVHFHISVGDDRRHDPDNLNWSISKPALDAMVGVLLVDDSIDHVRLHYSYDREKPRGFQVTLVGK
jgi:hypothetical protein